MSQIATAIEAGRCSLAVSGALLRDADVMLALKERGALVPMALSGPAVAPVQSIGLQGVARAVANPGGILALIEPGPGDKAGLTEIAKLLETAPNKPTVVVVAKRYDMFLMAGTFRGLKIEHVKDRGQAFLASLPEPPAGDEAPIPDVPSAKELRKAEEGPTPQLVLAGRDDEVAAVTEALGTGGPILLTGPKGSGRSWIVEHAIAATELTRLPDLKLGRGVGFDALAGRLAEICRAGGSDALATALTGPHKPADVVTAAIEALQAASGTESQVMVVDDIQIATGREGDFFRKSRLELLIEALLTNTYPLRLVFTSVVSPIFFREGRDKPLRRIPIGGIKGRFYHEIFEAYHGPEVSRDIFGPLSERLHGHPLAVRTAAVATRKNPKTLEDEKFFKMSGFDDTVAVAKQIEKRVAKLDDKPRRALTYLAHFRYPLDGSALAEEGINRKLRNHLVSTGVLDMVGTNDNRAYAVHDLTRRALGQREVTNFRTFADMGARYAKKAEGAEGLDKLVLQQEANRCLHGGRAGQSAVATEFPDLDAAVESVIGLIRTKTNPRFDIADARLTEILAADPSNSDAHLLKLEMLRRSDADNKTLVDAVEAALEAAPVPEVFHEAVGFHLSRNARNKAIKVLEDAVVALPDQSRLRTRLAALMMRAGRRPEAIDHLKQAMELDPMLPDAYGLLGMARREEGVEGVDEAETLLREAVRLNPGDVVQTSRLLGLLLDIAKGVPERREAVLEEVTALLDDLHQRHKESWEVHMLYAETLRATGGDLSRARWFLKKAKAMAPKRRSLDSRFELQRALLELAEGKVDDAEQHLRRLAKKDPTNHRVFAGIAKVLEARGQLIPAHAEYHRAAERAPVHSLDRQSYDMELARLQGIIEAGGGISAPQAAPAEEASAEPAKPAAEPPAVVRKKAAKAAPAEEATAAKAAPAEEATAADAAPAEEATATDAAPAEEATATDAAPAEEATATDAAPAEEAPAADAAPAEEATATDAAPAEEATATDAAPAEEAPAADAAPAADKPADA